MAEKKRNDCEREQKLGQEALDVISMFGGWIVLGNVPPCFLLASIGQLSCAGPLWIEHLS